jgi:3-methylcrotonyl-CoA carboxylase alpha subunit
VQVNAGDSVQAGDRLLVLEAMKMEHRLIAPFDGTVAEVRVADGAQVAEGSILLVLEQAAAA